MAGWIWPAGRQIDTPDLETESVHNRRRIHTQI